MENAQQRLLNKKQTAQYLQISKNTLNRYIKKGILTPIRIGYQLRFPSDVLSAVNNSKQPTAQQ